MKARVNLAQALLIRLGVPASQVLLGHLKDKSPQYRKKGPGRKHLQGGAR